MIGFHRPAPVPRTKVHNKKMNAPKKYIRILYTAVGFLIGTVATEAQPPRTLTLCEAVALAQEGSPAVMVARTVFRQAYWDWRSHRADQLPSLTLTSSPELNRSIRAVTQPDGSQLYMKQDNLFTDLGLRLNQNVPLTGGSVYVRSGISRLDELARHTVGYAASPLIVGYSQKLFGYNSMRWARKTEPLRYRQAKKEYAETLEQIAGTVVVYFYDLAAAESRLELARENLRNAEKNFKFKEGRYQLGLIAENEMMKLEIELLAQQSEMIDAEANVEDNVRLLRNYLGITDQAGIRLVHDDSIPDYKVDAAMAYDLALGNNSRVEGFRLAEIESENLVAQARDQRGMRADLALEFGLNQSAERFTGVYRRPAQSQMAMVTLSIPILDWGRGKGKVRVAQSRRDQNLLQLEQSKTDFRLSIFKTVRQFNMQYGQIEIARKRRGIADRRHEISQRLYELGKIDMIELTNAIRDKDTAREAYVAALRTYWDLHYAIRRQTGYDFINRREIAVDYDQIIN